LGRADRFKLEAGINFDSLLIHVKEIAARKSMT